MKGRTPLVLLRRAPSTARLASFVKNDDFEPTDKVRPSNDDKGRHRRARRREASSRIATDSEPASPEESAAIRKFQAFTNSFRICCKRRKRDCDNASFTLGSRRNRPPANNDLHPETLGRPGRTANGDAARFPNARDSTERLMRLPGRGIRLPGKSSSSITVARSTAGADTGNCKRRMLKT